jgi:hypothetical protein
MKTNIDDLKDEFEEKIIIDQDLRKNVLNLFLPLSTRMTYLYEFSKLENHQENYIFFAKIHYYWHH